MKETLATTHPQLAAQWHSDKNGVLAPQQILPGSNKKVWWRCPVNPFHEWMAIVSSRVKGNGCPICAGRVVTPSTSLLTLYPQLAREWHPTRNDPLLPENVRPRSGTKIWWQCITDSSHVWLATVASRSSGSGCPVCANRVATSTNSLRALYPQLALEWHEQKNGDLTPDHVVPRSGKKVWWRCSKDPSHEWQAVIGERVGGKRLGTGCAICASKRASNTTSLLALYPEVAVEWHPQKNGLYVPGDFLPNSNKKVWWQCRTNSSHEWEQVISARVKSKGCPICSGRIMTIETSLQARHPQLMREWNFERNINIVPEKVSIGSEARVWWRCQKDSSHEWQAVIYSRVSGRGCPICAGRIVTPITSLKATHPDLAKEWHPEKNGDLTPEMVTAGSSRQVWWRCQSDPPHQWQATITNRVKGRGCRLCGGRIATSTTSFQALYPQISQEWHPNKNGDLTPHDVRPGSNKKVWWRCSRDPLHEWQAIVQNRVKGNGCPICLGRITIPSTSLLLLYPELAREWHPGKNGILEAKDVRPGSNKNVWWWCQRDSSHEWQAIIQSRVKGHGPCPICSGLVANEITSLRAVHPHLAEEWHPDKNEGLTPDQVKPGSNQKVWWLCRREPAHEWQAVIASRIRGNGCPICAGQLSSPLTSLRALYPELAAEWHVEKNIPLMPDDVVPGSSKKVWWRCQSNSSHEWQMIINYRVKGHGCPECASLYALYPYLAEEWHPTKNGDLTPQQVKAGGEKKVWWSCKKDSLHEWQTSIYNRVHGSGCPVCHVGWTIETIRTFVASLQEHLPILTPAELYVLFQQSGLQAVTGKGQKFLKALATGRFPQNELQKFVDEQPSLVDAFIEDSGAVQDGELEMSDAEEARALVGRKGEIDEEENPLLSDEVLESVSEEAMYLPSLKPKALLAAAGSLLLHASDEEAIEFLISSAVAKIWNQVFRNELVTVAELEEPCDNEYGEQVRQRFLNEYHQVKALELPPRYDFRNKEGKRIEPNLMQRLLVVRVCAQKRVGNWSGTGAGKTLSAILASRVVNAKLTVICCPNSVVGILGQQGWKQAIYESFQESLVEVKTFAPTWKTGIDRQLGWSSEDDERPRYLILNYELFQQKKSATWIRSLVECEQIDCVIIDEIHYTKQRQTEDISRRRKLVATLVSQASERNPDLYVLGMSATPVINNLQEGKSLIELVTGVVHQNLATRSTVSNCMSLHQYLVRLGVRWMPEYHTGCSEEPVPVDCSDFLDEIRSLGSHGSPLLLEQILTRARLPLIRQRIKQYPGKTLIYTHLIQGIDNLLWNALVEDGWKVGFYTGEEKSGLDRFLNGDLDVLIGSSAISTGVDGLQQVCHQLIVNILPWTAAEFEQLKGRVFRQGQRNPVTIMLPLTYANINGERWSWCESKMHRLHFKKSIADAAVDGIVPLGHLRSPAQAYQDLMSWLKRLDENNIHSITRSKVVIPFAENSDEKEIQQRQWRYSDFSQMNHHWNQGHSNKTHQRLQANPEEWEHYHTLYRERRKEWAVIPYEEMIRWCQPRSDKVIGDFGCGEALLAQAVSDRHTVYSFDHVAINKEVIVCDMAHVPLDDETLDVAIFSLSLMGSNFTAYVREAHRTLKLDGLLHIIEATERFSDRDHFTRNLEYLGFMVIRVDDKWKFTHIQAIKAESALNSTIELHFHESK